MDDVIQSEQTGTYDPERWVAFWLRIAGVALLLGFFAPGFMFSERTSNPELASATTVLEWSCSWSWSHLGRLAPWGQVRMFLPLVLGLLWVALATPSAVRHRRRWLLLGSIAILFLQTVPGAARPIPMAGPWGEGILETLRHHSVSIGLMLAAVGCHLRWQYPDLPMGRKLAAVGGVLVVICLLSLQGGLGLLRELPRAEFLVPALIVVLVLAYGICAATAALPGGRRRAQICRWMARGYLLAAVPLSLVQLMLVDFGLGEDGTLPFWRALLSSLHTNGWIHGIGMTLALTLAVWLQPKAP